MADKVPRSGEETQSRRSLQTLFPDDVLTKYLLEQRQEWITTLEEWRHNIVHHRCLQTGEFREGGVLIFLRRDEDFLTNPVDFQRDATTLVSAWTTQLKELLLEVFKLIEKRALEIADPLEMEQAKAEQTKLSNNPNMTNAMEVLHSFLEHWKTDPIAEPEKYRRMYAALTGTWRKEWKPQEFRQFIENYPLRAYQFVGGVSSGTDPQHGQIHRAGLILTFDKGAAHWWFALIPDAKHLMRLHLIPFSVPPSFTKRIQVGTVQRGQSGKETGYRDVIFSGIVHNSSDVTLADLEAHIFCKEMSEASASLGTLGPGEEKNFVASWSDASVPFHPDFPPISTDLLWGSPVRIRITYRLSTSEGSLWAEDVTLA